MEKGARSISRETVLAIDNGTQSIHTLFFDLRGKLLPIGGEMRAYVNPASQHKICIV